MSYFRVRRGSKVDSSRVRLIAFTFSVKEFFYHKPYDLGDRKECIPGGAGVGGSFLNKTLVMTPVQYYLKILLP